MSICRQLIAFEVRVLPVCCRVFMAFLKEKNPQCVNFLPDSLYVHKVLEMY